MTTATKINASVSMSDARMRRNYACALNTTIPLKAKMRIPVTNGHETSPVFSDTNVLESRCAFVHSLIQLL